MSEQTQKPKVATCWLAGCAGCHMSFLDIDERILELAELVEFTASPITDIKKPPMVDIAIIEGAVANEENREVLELFRKNSKFLIALGDCAVFGNIPAMRNNHDLKDIFKSVYLDSEYVVNGVIPDGPDLPKLLPKVLPVPQIVKVDFNVPGCPPDADAIWFLLTELLKGNVPKPEDIPYELFKYD